MKYQNKIYEAIDKFSKKNKTSFVVLEIEFTDDYANFGRPGIWIYIGSSLPLDDTHRYGFGSFIIYIVDNCQLII